MISQHLIDLRLNPGSHGFLFSLLKRNTSWERIAEIKHQSIELNHTEHQAQNIRLIHYREPKSQEHAGEKCDSSDQKLLFENLVHIDLRPVPERQPGQPREAGQSKHGHERGWGKDDAENVYQRSEQQEPTNPKRD